MLYISIILNIIFAIVFIYVGIRYKDLIYIRFIEGLRKQADVVMFGDSIIKHGEWYKLLKRTDVRVSGFVAYTTHHLHSMKESQVLYYKPKICFVHGGGNDVFAGVPLPVIYGNYKGIVETLQQNNIIVVVISTLGFHNAPEVNKQLNELNSFLMNYCKEKKIDFIDINSIYCKDGELSKEYTTDGAHLKPYAYKFFGDLVKQKLKEKGI